VVSVLKSSETPHWTVISTLSDADPVGLVTVSWNVRTSFGLGTSEGAVNVGFGAAALESVTEVPATRPRR
jgi:hypothetical protein